MDKTSSSSIEMHPWSLRTADTMLQRHPSLAQRWQYESGVALLGILRAWQKSGKPAFFDYVKRNIDEFVDPSGYIRTYQIEEYNIDQINEGKLLFALYAETADERYKKAILLLREQLRTQPRNGLGGFWHKLIYPHQMWLDGIYMASPFYTQFAADFGEAEIFDDVAHQIVLIERQTRDPKTGLLYHGWDASRSQRWADPKTGCSPNFWGRAMGWFLMALPDILDYFPQEHPQRAELVRILRDTALVAIKVQDEDSGVWYQVLDQGKRPGNYLEASASCMFVYALAKAVRQGYLDSVYLQAARRGYQGILEHFVAVDEQGWVNLHQICSVGGLGGNPYRDGTYDYYISEKIVSNDYKGIGPFIMASVEMENAQSPDTETG